MTRISNFACEDHVMVKGQLSVHINLFSFFLYFSQKLKKNQFLLGHKFSSTAKLQRASCAEEHCDSGKRRLSCQSMCTVMYSTAIYRVVQKTGPPINQSPVNCKYSENSMTELRGNW